MKISGGTQTNMDEEFKDDHEQQASDSDVDLLFGGSKGATNNRNSCNLNQQQKSQQQLGRVLLCADKSLSLTGSVASQLSEGLRDKILSSQSLPKGNYNESNGGRLRTRNHHMNWEEESVKSQPPLSLYNHQGGDEVYSYLGGYASSVMTEPIRSEGDNYKFMHTSLCKKTVAVVVREELCNQPCLYILLLLNR